MMRVVVHHLHLCLHHVRLLRVRLSGSSWRLDLINSGERYLTHHPAGFHRLPSSVFHRLPSFVTLNPESAMPTPLDLGSSLWDTYNRNSGTVQSTCEILGIDRDIYHDISNEAQRLGHKHQIPRDQAWTDGEAQGKKSKLADELTGIFRSKIQCNHPNAVSFIRVAFECIIVNTWKNNRARQNKTAGPQKSKSSTNSKGAKPQPQKRTAGRLFCAFSDKSH